MVLKKQKYAKVYVHNYGFVRVDKLKKHLPRDKKGEGLKEVFKKYVGKASNYLSNKATNYLSSKEGQETLTKLKDTALKKSKEGLNKFGEEAFKKAYKNRFVKEEPVSSNQTKPPELNDSMANAKKPIILSVPTEAPEIRRKREIV